MEARDAIVSWLEHGDHFVRVTAASPLSPSTREVQALHELAAYVNRVLPRANWDARHTKQMLKHYLQEFRSTASADVPLGEKERRCRHFSRLKKLHEPKEREVAAAKKWDQENRQSNAQTTYVKLVFALTEAQRCERENEVVPESDFSNSCENSEADKSAMKRAGVGEQVQVGKEESGEKTASSKDKKMEEKCVKKSEQKEKEPKKQESMQKPTPGFLELTSDEEEVDEELPVVRRSTRAKRRASRDAVKSAHKDEHGSTSGKKRLESASDKSGYVEVSDVTPTQTTQAAISSGSDAARDSPMNYEDAPSLRTRSQDKNSLGKKRRSVGKVTSASQPARSSSKAQRSETPRHKAQPTKKAATTSNQVPSTVPGSLRSAIAEVVSQRQQLLGSCRNDPESQGSFSCQTRQRRLSGSDYGLSDIDLPSVDPRPSASSNDERTSKPSYEPRSVRHEAGPPGGLLPPLIDWSHTNMSKLNLKRKRVFLSTKQLAFEQLKWYREKELQQCELELLHHEMEAREVLAHEELELKRMRIRADIIQPMIFAGASIADIAERLDLL
ncbi:hypothetical protein KRP22_011834 [Phytophthora ramorum]|nr:hypothetical protein KRP22_11672 [Phytophthora ramorum]